jgi:SAM-dependent methyltransferase
VSWLNDGHRLLPAVERQIREKADQERGGEDWEQQLARVAEVRTAIHGSGQRCLLELQQLAETTEQLRLLVGRDYIEHLQRTTTRSLKLHIRAMPAGPLKKAAMQYFVQWKDCAMLEAVKAKAVCWDRPLPRSADFGRGMDSRVVEIPLAFDQGDFRRPGKVLDAGCALNHSFMHDLVPASGVHLVHMTQSAEKEPILPAADRFSYVFGDLRALDFRDGAFDRVLCISTLEHVGSDNTKYFATNGNENRKDSYLDALRELLRVLQPGGVLLLTFPCGPYQDHGWYQVMGAVEIGRMLEVAHGHRTEVKYYYSDGYWFEGPAEVMQTMPNDTIEDAVAAVRIIKN